MPLAWQLASAGAEAGLPGTGRDPANMWGQGKGKNVGVHETLMLQCPCPGYFPALFPSCSQDPQMDLQRLVAGPMGQVLPWTWMPIYMVKASKISEEGP